MNERREISFLLTVEDHIAFNLFGHRRLPFWQRHLFLSLMGGGLLYGIVVIFVHASALDLSAFHVQTFMFVAFSGLVLLFGIIGGLLWRLHPSQLPRRVRAMLAKPQNRHLVGEKTMSIGPEGITIQSPHAQTLIRWDMIEEIEETDDHAFFFFSQRNALILPRRPFPAEEDYEDFMNLARRYHEGLESVSRPQPESFSPHPTSDGEFTSNTRRASEPPTVLRDDEEQSGACRNLSFILTVEDHVAFNMLLHSRQPFWRRYLAFLMMSLIVPIAAFMLFSVTLEPQAPPEQELILKVLCLGSVSVFAAIIAVFNWRMHLAKIGKQVRTLLAHPQNQKLVGEMTIRITPQEVISKSMTGTTSLSWERIEEIVVTAHYAFFFCGERNAIIIPKRPRQAEEFEEFVDLARQYHEGTANVPESPIPPEERIVRSDGFLNADKKRDDSPPPSG